MSRFRSPARAVAALLSTVVALLLTGALPAAAHNTLTSSDPAAGAVISVLPQTFSLTFDDQVRDEFVTVVLTPDGGSPITLDPTVTATLPAATLPAATPDPGQGRAFRVGYRVISADGHPISGSTDFTVGTTALPFTGGAAGASSASADAAAVDAPVASAGSGTDGGIPVGWWVAAGALVLAVVVAAPLWLRSRRPGPSDRAQPAALPPPR